MRAFAILTVVVCHSTEAVYPLTLDGINSLGGFSQLSAFVLFTVGRFGVPCFLFLSGYLMLDRFYDKQKCISFWRNKWLGILLAAEIWIVVYNLFLCIFGGESFSLIRLFENMLFVKSVGMGHMWYIPMIIGLYLFLPFMANGLKWLDEAKLLTGPLAVALVLFFFLPVASTLLQSFGLSRQESLIAQGFSGGTYGCYLLLGYCCKKKLFGRVPLGVLILGGIASFACTVFLQMLSYARGVYEPLWYNNGLLLVASLCFFLVKSHSQSKRLTEPTRLLSKYSFAIYLVHFPVILLLSPLFAQVPLPFHCLEVILLSAVALSISLMICVAIARIPGIGAKMLYMR